MSLHVPTKRRTTTGCLTCRFRKKKCNERKPTCTGCSRNFLICTWPDADGKQPAAQSERQSLSTPATFVTVGAHGSRVPSTASVSRITIPHPLGFMPGQRKQHDGPLFDHYVKVTSLQLTGKVEPNPFLANVIPLAYHDAAVFESLLAISGAQLCVKSATYERQTRAHYAVAIRDVKHKLTSWQGSDSTMIVALCTVTIILCLYETIIGDANGNFFYHLRACRSLLLELRGKHAHTVERSTLDLLIELYAHMAITSNITLRSDLSPSRHIPQDDFLSAEFLKSLNEGNDLHGVMFGVAHDIFAMINPIAHEARHFLDNPDDDKKSLQRVEWETKIKSWSPSPNYNAQSAPWSKGSVLSVDDEHEIAGVIYQKSLLIFLYSMFNGTATPTQELTSKIDVLVVEVFKLIAILPVHTHVRTTMMWTCIVCSACVRNVHIRRQLIMRAAELPYTMVSAKRAYEFLILLWQEMDMDENIYGMWGVEHTMKKHGIQFSCVWTICCGNAPNEEQYGVEIPSYLMDPSGSSVTVR